MWSRDQDIDAGGGEEAVANDVASKGSGDHGRPELDSVRERLGQSSHLSNQFCCGQQDNGTRAAGGRVWVVGQGWRVEFKEILAVSRVFLRSLGGIPHGVNSFGALDSVDDRKKVGQRFPRASLSSQQELRHIRVVFRA